MQNSDLNLIDVIPREWLDAEGSVSVMVSAYQGLFYKPSETLGHLITSTIGDVQYVALEGSLTYQTIDMQITGFSEGTIQARADQQDCITPQGTYIMFITRFDPNNLSISEAEAIGKIETARGLIIAIEGKSAAFAHIYNLTIKLPQGVPNLTSPAIRTPDPMHPFLDADRLPRIATALNTLDAPTRNRVELGLRWFDKSERDVDGLDSFLKVWFAIETIGIPNGTNIRPMEEALAQAYSRTYEQIKTQFQIGRIYNLRGKIVHNGEIHPIHGQLQRFLSAIFVDLLLQTLSLPSEHRAQAIIDEGVTGWYP